MELADYLRLLRTHWIAIVLLTLFGTGAAWGWTFLQQPVYQANSSGIVTVPTNGDLAYTSIADNVAKSRATTYVTLGESRAVAQRVIDALKLKTTPEELVGRVDVTNVEDTPSIAVSARAATPEAAKELADAWIHGLSDQIVVLQDAATTATTTDADGNPTTDITANAITLVAVESAVVPSTPIFPNIRLSIALGALAGLVIGLAVAVLRTQLDRRLGSAQAIERLFDIPVLGALPRDKRLDDDTRILPDEDAAEYVYGSSRFALPEALRELRTNLQFVNVDHPPRIIIVTSPLPNDGKSTVTANLAVTLAAAGERVIVVDGDLRKPSVAKAFGMVPGVGITDLLIGKAEIQDVLQPWGSGGNLYILGAGSIPPNPSEILGSQGMKVLLQDLAKTSIVLVDAPPVLPVTDAAVLAGRADGTIIVVSAGKTTVDHLEKARHNLARTNGKVLGVILNKIPKAQLKRESYYYGAEKSPMPREDAALVKGETATRARTMPPQPATAVVEPAPTLN